MESVLHLIMAVAALALFAWLLLGSTRGTTADIEIDPDDPRQVGLLMGMMGGRVADAVIVRFALQRFEEDHGRRARANVRDIGAVAAMVRGVRR